MDFQTLATLPDPPRDCYHWTLPRQRAFLEHFAISGSVTHAAAHVGVSPRAAYDLRHRREGLLFGLGWGAAVFLARYRLTDLLLERAIDGVEEVSVRTNGAEDGTAEVRRRKYDGRLGMAMLARLDRMTMAAASDHPEEIALYRAVAQDFENFLDRLSPPPEPAAPTVDTAADCPAPAHAEPVTPVADAAAIAMTAADQAAAHAALEADARADAQARVSAHLAATASGPGPLARLARECGVHCEVAQKSADAAKEAEEWTPPKPTRERARELNRQIHDLLDKIEDRRAAAGLDAIDIRWDSCELAEAVGELVDMAEEKLLPFGCFLLDELAPYGAAWRDIDPADIDPDSDFARYSAPANVFDSVEMRREDSIKARIDRLMAVGKAPAALAEQVAATEGEMAD